MGFGVECRDVNVEAAKASVGVTAGFGSWCGVQGFDVGQTWDTLLPWSLSGAVGACPWEYPVCMAFTRITSDPDQMSGVPCIRGLRFPVATVVAMVADGMATEEILSEHPDLEAEDITEALKYAALAVQERQLPLLSA